MFAEVLLEIKSTALDQTFTYKIEPPLLGNIKEGMRVLVPFGNQKLEGFVLKIKNSCEENYQIKSILSCQDEEPVLNEELLRIGDYISKITLSTKISAYQTMLPVALKANKKKKTKKKYQSYFSLNEKIENILPLCKTNGQKQIIEIVHEKGEVSKEILKQISLSSLQSLLKYGFLKEVKKEVYRTSFSNLKERKKVHLTLEQNKIVYKVLERKNFHPFLLHGITGSGKTEVYMEIIEQLLKKGKEAIVLVPEISLTPQFLSKFRNRFGDQIAVLHSRLSSGEKYDEWRKIEKGEVSIAIGARSAIFAPFRNLGIIILDEEHSTSYKQTNHPKYHAIDIALFRGKYHECPVLLGSATPSIESYTRARAGIYHLLELKERVTGKLPTVTLVDMKEEIKKGYQFLSSTLLLKMENTLKRKKQILLLLNRRGYSTIVMCASCGYVSKCPHCDIPLVFHKTSKIMRCHYCGYGMPKIKECPDCHYTDFHFYGTGTQKLEEEITKLFPDTKVLRMDADVTNSKHAYDEIVRKFETEEYGILIGTQMIAKGLDFKGVELVGVLCADASLHIPDFRSGERTFCLLSQVSGRAGRNDQDGEVVFQGFNMSHYSIIKASIHDYVGFYHSEMDLRKKMGYPPYYNLSSIIIRAKQSDKAYAESKKIRSFLEQHTSNVMILGPTPSTIAKVNDFYYFKILLKYKKKNDIIKALQFIYEKYRKNKQVIVEIDLNPIQI